MNAVVNVNVNAADQNKKIVAWKTKITEKKSIMKANACHEYDEQCCHPIYPCNIDTDCNDSVSVIEAISIAPQTVLSLATLPFDTNRVIDGNAITHIQGSPNFNLLRCVLYRVTFTSTVSLPVGVAGTNVSAAIALNGSIIAGTTVSESVINLSGNFANLATQTIIEVYPGTSSVVTIVNPSALAEIFTNPNIIIEKIN